MTRSISEEIKTLRVAAGFQTLGDLYRASRVSVSTLSRIEAGIQKPTPATLKKLAPYLGVSYEYLMIAAGYLPPPGELIAQDDSGIRGVLDIDEILSDDNRPIRMGGKIISPEVRLVLQENLRLIKKLISNSSKTS